MPLRHLLATLLACTATAPTAVAAGAGAAAEGEARRALEACLEGHWARRGGSARVTLRASDRSGEVSESGGRLQWGSAGDEQRVRFEVSDPEDVRGTAMWVVEREGEEPRVMVSLPELDEPRRLRQRGAGAQLFGTDFSVEDLRRLHALGSDGSLQVHGDARLGDRDVFEVVLEPDEATESGYREIVSYVDRETCVPLRTEFFARGGGLRKVLRVEPAWIERRDDGFVPAQWVMEDVRDGSHTRLLLDDVRFGVSRAAEGPAPAAPEDG